jgi:hypothetical protein
VLDPVRVCALMVSVQLLQYLYRPCNAEHRFVQLRSARLYLLQLGTAR